MKYAKELFPRLRDGGLTAQNLSHPIISGQVAQGVANIWHSTVKVLYEDKTGSGCVVSQGGKNGDLILTNAHVVNGFDDIAICQWTTGYAVQETRAKVIALDYIHDLALLEPQDISQFTGQRRALEIGQSPLPGQVVTVCGFPLGCDTPRLAQGLVSGYEALAPEGLDVTSVVIQAPINQGNSGGPVCDESGNLVGVIWSINPRFRNGLPKPKSPTARSAIDWVERSMIPIDGYGYALDPADVVSMLQSIKRVRNLGRHEQQHPPKWHPFPRHAFVDLQRQATCAYPKVEGMSCVGIFNYAPDGSIYLGWHGGQQARLSCSEAWPNLCRQFFPQGGHFYLRGYELIHYYKGRGYKSGIWIPRVHLLLTNETA